MHDLTADEYRIYRLFQYLCLSLAAKRRPDGDLNRNYTARRLDNSEFRKVLRDFQQFDMQIQAGERSGLNFPAALRKLTTGRLVEMVGHLQGSLEDDYKDHQEPYTSVLTLEEVLLVLHHLTELTADERQQLRLKSGDSLTLLQRILLNIQIKDRLSEYETIFTLYKTASGLDMSSSQQQTLQSLDQVDALISHSVTKSLQYLPPRQARKSSKGTEEIIQELTNKAQREIRRLLVRSGNQQGQMASSTTAESYIQNYLKSAFLEKLSEAVVQNERLTKQFPIYLKQVSISRCGPLPFSNKETSDPLISTVGPYRSLLNPALREFERLASSSRVSQLDQPSDYDIASQEATRVTLEFYVRVPESYEPVSEETFKKLASEDRSRIDFSVSSVGIGGSLSHIIKVLNATLLFDIPCLDSYFSIAHDVISTQEIIRHNVPSPLWAHSLVKLCRKEVISEAIKVHTPDSLELYDRFSSFDPIGHGDYCGFDFITCISQASLMSRLQAIQRANVISIAYVKDLCHRTEQKQILDEAWSCLRGYPFSTLAMVGLLYQKLLQPLGERSMLTKSDSYIYFNTCLSITEALLAEGAYRSAKKFLSPLSYLGNLLNQGLEIGQNQSGSNGSIFEVFSGSAIIRYALCVAQYCYLYDDKDRDRAYLPPECNPDINRDGLIRRAWEKLEHAQININVRLKKYAVINEVSQGSFHPHYQLLATIAFLRAKLLMFFPSSVPRDEQRLPTDRFVGTQRTTASVVWGALHQLEKARLYIAADGDSETYSCYAAMQCWAYLVAAFLDEQDLSLPFDQKNVVLSRQKCLNWAYTLRDHALISYADTGRQCYYQIKEKSGISEERSKQYGSYKIQFVPAIYEAKEQDNIWQKEYPENLLVIDMSLLSVNPNTLRKLAPDHPSNSIYLFGPNACYLLFARGLCLLCSNSVTEFQEEAITTLDGWGLMLDMASRLLNMAWAFAEDGGHFERDTTEKGTFRVTRPYATGQKKSEFTTINVDSIRDLYPCRTSEIADIGKIFAAAAIALKTHIVPIGIRNNLELDIQKLLDSIHGHDRFSENRTFGALVSRQKRYNGHLQSYFEAARSIIIEAINRDAESTTSPKALLKKRNRLLKELFSIPTQDQLDT